MTNLIKLDKYTYVIKAEILSISASNNIDIPFVSIIHLKNGNEIYSDSTPDQLYDALNKFL